MTVKDFNRMPVGKFYAKDKIYEYKLAKHITDDGLFYISLSLKTDSFMTGPTVGIHQENKPYFDEHWERQEYGDPKFISVSYSSGVGMIFFSSDREPYYLKELKLLSRGSFAEYVKNELKTESWPTTI